MPKTRRPVWLLLLIGALMLGLGLLSFNVWGGAEAVPTTVSRIPDAEPLPPTAEDGNTRRADSPADQPSSRPQRPADIERPVPADEKPRPAAVPKANKPRRAPAKPARTEVVNPWQ